MNERIEISNYQSEPKGSLLGKFDVVVSKWGVKIIGMCHFQKDGKEWLGLPTFWKKDTNNGSYSPSIEFLEKRHEQEFKRVVMEELKRFL